MGSHAGDMLRHLPHAATADLICDSCGQLPEPGKTRVTLANVAVMLPIELLVHAAVVNTGLPYLAKVLVLAVTATALVIFVADPAAARLLRSFLHAPAIRRRRRLDAAAALWRARVLVRDEPGALERITRRLARLDINILSIHVHPAESGTLDEFVLSAPAASGRKTFWASCTTPAGGLPASGRRRRSPSRMDRPRR